MTTETKKERRRIKTSKNIWILLILLLFVGVITVSLYQSQVNPANVDFEIVNTGWDDLPPRLGNSGSVAIIYGVAVTFKSVGGDAHEVFVSWEGGPGSEPQDMGLMLEDAPGAVILFSYGGYISRREESGYPVEISVTSLETGTKEIKFYVLI